LPGFIAPLVASAFYSESRGGVSYSSWINFLFQNF
jgi:hypothetical protein